MEIQLLSWDSFTEIKNAKKLWLQYVDIGPRYILALIDTPLMYTYTILKEQVRSVEQTDFEDNYKNSIDTNRPLNLSGSSTTSVFGGDDNAPWGIVAANEASGYTEFQFAESLYFNKMYAMMKDAEWADGQASGDYVTVSIWMPTEGGDVKIKDYSKKIPCWGSHPSGWMEGTGAGLLPAGLKLRVTYYKGPNTSTGVRRFALIPEFLI